MGRKRKLSMDKFNKYDGFFETDRLTKIQKSILKDYGYEEINTNPYGQGLGTSFMVKTRGLESAIHALFCYIIEREIKKYTDEVEQMTVVGPDIVFSVGYEQWCIEVETGTIADKLGDEYLAEKFGGLKAGYGEKYYIFVTKAILERKYKKYGKVMMRRDIQETIGELFG